MNIYKEVDSNKRKSVLFIGLFLIVIVALGWLISAIYNNYIILWLAVIISVVQAMISYYSGDKISLAISGAKEVQKQESPRLFRTVENLSITAGLPMPKVYIIDDEMPNAFATGRDPEHASIAVTRGLLDEMSDNELQGVIAHEMSHIGNYDIRLMMIVVVLVSVIALISDLFIRMRFFGFGRSNRDNGGEGQGILILISVIAMILAPISATLIQLAISRKREFLADSSGVLLTRYPDGLASALEKISEYKEPMRNVSTATSHLYIGDPLGSKESYLSKILSTHPPIAERIAKLKAMEK
jgi:heat shock protein HtpX